MATEVETRRWCDVCLGRSGQKVEAEAATVALNGTVRELDLCQSCGDEFLAPLTKLMGFGYEPEKPHRPRARELKPNREPIREGDFRCRVCNSDLRHRGALNTHLKSVHGLSASARVGYMPPARHGTGGVKVCPDCGKELGGAAGLGSHRKYAHGITGTSAGAIKARTA